MNIDWFILHSLFSCPKRETGSKPSPFFAVIQPLDIPVECADLRPFPAVPAMAMPLFPVRRLCVTLVGQGGHSVPLENGGAPPIS